MKKTLSVVYMGMFLQRLSKCLLSCLFFAYLFFVNSPLEVWGESLTPIKVIESALAHHPAIKAQLASRDNIAGDLLSSQGAFDPAIVGKDFSYLTGGYSGASSELGFEKPLQLYGSRFFAGYRRSGGKFPVYDGDYLTNSNGEISFGVEVPLLRNREIDERRAKILENEAKVVGAEVIIEQERIEVARDALQAYWTWVAAGERYGVYRALVTVAEERTEQLNVQAQLGDVANILVTDNQRALLKRQAELLKANEALQRSRLQLSLYLFSNDGIPIIPDDSELPKTLPPVMVRDYGEPEPKVDQALLMRPELRSIKQKLEMVSARQRLANNQLLPELNAVLTTSNDYGNGSGGSDTSRGEAEVKGGIQVKIPLYMRKARGMVQSADAQERELNALRTLYTQKIDRDVRKSLIALTVVGQRIDVARNEVKAAKELEKGERIKFSQGDSNLIFVNLREQTTADAEISLIDAILDFHVYRAELDATMGKVPQPD
jgi:cobalt-zinc-cadmium efflux system outer membrane protein